MGQWGLTQDNNGQVIFSNAGYTTGPLHTNFSIMYSNWQPKWVRSKRFKEIYAIDNIADTQGGPGALRPDKSLKSFTATCGQSVFRGDRLPQKMQGHMFFSEPVGRVIRRTEFKVDEMGRSVMHNVYQEEEKEFIATKDANFRAVNTATGPDGTLYIVDMYRGIIQQGGWVNKGSYLRKAVQYYGLDKNIGKGRIYRLRHKDFEPNDKKPRMLEETPKELVSHLAHPNGWWRDEAQKLIVLSGDKSVEADLKTLFKSNQNYLARLHALWTLDGLGLIDLDFLKNAYQDSHAEVRAAAVRITEQFFQEDIAVLDQLKRLTDDKSVVVGKQLILSMSVSKDPKTREIAKAVLTKNPENTFFQKLDDKLNAEYFEEQKRLAELAKLNAEEAALMDQGSKHYKALCSSCHGADAKGALSPEGALIAPPFVNNPRINGSKEILTRIALKGFTGPIEGKTYAGMMMVPLADNDDNYLASVLTYIRNSFGNEAGMITEREVKKYRKKAQSIQGPLNELGVQKMMKDIPVHHSQWKVSASRKETDLKNIFDGDNKTFWATRSSIKKGDYIQVEFPYSRNIFKVLIQSEGDDYPEQLKVEMSEDGKIWSTVLDGVKGNRMSELSFKKSLGKFIRISADKDKGRWWRIKQLEIIGPGMGDLDEHKSENVHFLKVNEGNIIKQGWGDFKQNTGPGGDPIKIGGQEFAKGIGTHSYSEIEFENKAYDLFYAHVGHHDGGNDTTVEFVVKFDGVEAYRSGSMKKGQKAKLVELDITGVKKLSLITDTGSDGETGGDHAAWAKACLIK